MIISGRYIFCGLFLYISTLSFSQEFSIYQNCYLTPFIINAGATGVEDYTVANLSVKRQWMGFDEAPVTYKISGNFRFVPYDFYDPKGFLNNGPLKVTDRIGLGGALIRDITGPLSYTGALLSFAYHIPLQYGSVVSFGLSATGSYYSFNSSILRLDNPNDAYLMDHKRNIFKPNFGIGIYYHNDKYFGGISSNNFLPDIAEANDKIKSQPNFFVLGGYHISLRDGFFLYEPSFMLKKIGDENISCDIYQKIYLKNFNWIAISVNTQKKVNFQFGFRFIKNLYIGYNYEYIFSEISKYNNGSHEAHLGINLGMIRMRGIRETLRF